jgi:hypothetical protein
MATFNKYNSFPEVIAEGNLATDTLKVALSNTAPSASHTQLSQVSEVSAGAGYTAGGEALSVSSSGQSGGTYSLVISDDVVWTSTGSFPTSRYVILYDYTLAGDPLLGWWDNGSSISPTSGQEFQANIAGTLLSGS